MSITSTSTLKMKIKTESDDKSWHAKTQQSLIEPDIKIKVEEDEEFQASTSDNESHDEDYEESVPNRSTSNFKNIISKYVGYNIDDLNTIDKNRTKLVSDSGDGTKKKRVRHVTRGTEDAVDSGVKKRNKKVKSMLGMDEMEERKKMLEEKKREKESKKQAKKEKKKSLINVEKKPSDMENVFGSLDEMESSEEDEDGVEDWEDIHLALFSPFEYTCRVCDWKLNSYDKLLRHIKSDHGGYETSSLCYHCGYYSKNRSTLKNHVRVEHGENQAKRKEKKICDICSAEVVHLAIHKKHSHSGTYHVCPHCGKKFTRKAELQLHIKGIHMKHQLEKTYICEYCHKEFTFYNYLRRHMRVHTNEKPYKCKDCGAAFNHNVSLKNHKNSSCPKRATPAPPRPESSGTRPSQHSNSTSPSHLGQTAMPSVPTLAANSGVRIPKFDRRQHQRSMMEMFQNSSNIPTNVPFPAVFDAAHMYYYG